MRGIWNPDDKGTVLCGLVTIAMENQGKINWGKGSLIVQDILGEQLVSELT